MTNTKAQREAAEWLIELKTTEDIDALWPAFYAWYQLCENRSAYLELEQAWAIGKRALVASAPRRPPVAAQIVDEVRTTSPQRRTRYGIGVVMGVLMLGTGLAFLLKMWLLPQFDPHISWSRYKTTYGEISSKILADGSKIHLNTNSRMWVRLTPELREVSLEQGEALFTVAPDPSRPFSVTVGKDLLRAVGTEFSVRREPGGNVSAFVTQGTIEVLDHDRPDPNPDTSGDKFVRASAGDVVNITPTRTVVVKVGPSGVQQRLAWLGGQIDFDGTIADAVAEFNRYNRRRLEIIDPVISQKHIQGLFKATDPDRFAQEVRDQLGVPYTYLESAAPNAGVIRIGAAN